MNESIGNFYDLQHIDITNHVTTYFKSEVWNLDSCEVKNNFKSINIKLNSAKCDDDRDSFLTLHRCEDEYDDQTVKPTLAAAPIFGGELDLCIHPTYRTPCPYLRIWNNRGEMVQASESSFRCCIMSGVDESVSYALCEHPILGYPCYELHICALSETMNALLQPVSDLKQHYLTVLLSLIGPKIGIYRKDFTC